MADINSLIVSTINNIPVPHFGKPNLTLVFQVGTGLFANDLSGNLAEQTVDLVVEASVAVDLNNKEFEMPGQIGQTSIILGGRCVLPKVLPSTITYDMNAKAMIKHRDEFEAEVIGVTEGIFTFIPVVQNRFPAFTEHMGTKIKGYFNTIARV